MSEPDDSPTLGAAHARAFPRGPTPAQYDDRLLRLEYEGVPFVVPNPPAHGAALRLHDLHHVLTEYDTSWIGEAEVGTYELAGGCGAHVGAFPFDLASIGMGVVIAPRRTFRAWVRGRRAKNLFARPFDRAVLDRPIDEVRRELGLDRAHEGSTPADALGFAFWAILGAAFLAAAPISFPLGLAIQLAPAPRR